MAKSNKAKATKTKRKIATRRASAATSKRDRIDTMLQRPEGVTIGQITKRFAIKPHSARNDLDGPTPARQGDRQGRRRAPTPM